MIQTGLMMGLPVPTTDKDIPAFNLDFGFKNKLLEGAGWLCFCFLVLCAILIRSCWSFCGVYLMDVIWIWGQNVIFEFVYELLLLRICHGIITWTTHEPLSLYMTWMLRNWMHFLYFFCASGVHSDQKSFVMSSWYGFRNLEINYDCFYFRQQNVHMFNFHL